MPPHNSDRIQELTSRVFGLHFAVQASLRALAVFYGDKADREIKLLRDKLINEFKQSGIPADREMEHAQIVGPAIDAIELAFDEFLRDLPNERID
jgi:hypothetical protein